MMRSGPLAAGPLAGDDVRATGVEREDLRGMPSRSNTLLR
jgi:hypothetical protein